MKYPSDKILLEKLDTMLKVQQYFLIPHLRSEEVARELGIPNHKLSHLLNTYTGENFNDYINRFRVDFACRIIAVSNGTTLTCNEIATQSGFSSRSVFYDAFKQLKNLPPKEYIRKSINQTY